MKEGEIILKKTIIYSLLVSLSLFSASSFASASPGGTDSNGGHVCRTNCSQYGLKTGEYHYHRDGKIVKVPTSKPSASSTSKPVASTSSLAYNEAVKQGELLNSKLSEYNQVINGGNIEKINALYDTFTKQLKNEELKIGKVPGSTNRAKLNEKYVRPSKIAVERTIYEVSQFRLLNIINNLIEQKKVNEAKSKLQVLDRLKKRAVEIKRAGGYKVLPSTVDAVLRQKESSLRAATGNNGPIAAVKNMEVHFIDVGQGDSTLLITPNRKTILVDGGKESAGDEVLAYLAKRGINSIDVVVATHPDADHIGGLVPVLKNIKVSKVIDSGKVHTTQTYLNYLKLIDEKNIPMEIAKEGQKLNVDSDITIQVLNALHESDDTNDSSIVLKVSYKQSDFLLTGDAGKNIEEEMINDGYNLEAEVLKVGHHGSDTSTSETLLQAVHPNIAAISVGENSYGHSSTSVVNLLKKYTVQIFTTKQYGDILITTDGSHINVNK